MLILYVSNDSQSSVIRLAHTFLAVSILPYLFVIVVYLEVISSII